MFKWLMMFVLFFGALPINVGKADDMSLEARKQKTREEELGIIRTEDVPPEIREQCKQEVLKKQPLKVTYNWGKLKLYYSEKTDVACSDAAGWFEGSSVSGHTFSEIPEEFIQIGEYRCYYPVGNYHLTFFSKKSGMQIDTESMNMVTHEVTHESLILASPHIVVKSEYSGCSARTILRHELQHFMIWKTGWEQMLIELQNTLLDQSLVFCKDCIEAALYTNFRKIVERIYNKWRDIIKKNHERLDEIDHDRKKEVSYRVCYPLIVRTGLVEF